MYIPSEENTFDDNILELISVLSNIILFSDYFFIILVIF